MTPNEVRRCAGCGQPAAVCIRDWQHKNWLGNSGMSTRDFCCQACGHRFTLIPKPMIAGHYIAACVLILTIVGFPLIGSWAFYRTWPWLRNPVVPGAPVPPMRFRAVEPTRSCAACGGPALCRSVTRRSVNLVPTGTDYVYACTRCQKSFALTSPYGIVFNLCAAAFLSLVGIALLAALIGIPILLGALVYGAWAMWGVVQYLRHPVLADAV